MRTQLDFWFELSLCCWKLLLLVNGLPDYLQKSLFPDVPPYIRFTPIYKKTLIPTKIRQHLLWPTAIPGERKQLHDNAIKAAGLRLVPPDPGGLPVLGWLKTPPVTSHERKRPNKSQKVNRFPGFSQVSLKDRMWLNLKKLKDRFPLVNLHFVPQTFILPQEAIEFRRAWEQTKNKLWMTKLPAESRGRGIRMLEHWRQFRAEEERAVVQKYVHNPYLYDSLKVELQYTFVLTSVHPLRIYSLPEGLKVKLGKANYSDHPVFAQDKCIHSYNAEDCDRPVAFFWSEGAAMGQNMKNVLSRIHADVGMDRVLHLMDEALIMTLVAAAHKLSTSFQNEAQSRYSHFHVMRADFVLDKEGKPWLLEINSSPIRGLRNSWLVEVEQNYYSEILNLAGYHFPPSLGKAAQDLIRRELNWSRNSGVVLNHVMYDKDLRQEDLTKQMEYQNITERWEYQSRILDKLTLGERWMLRVAEDELNRVKVAKRVFPTKSTSKYLKFIHPENAYYYKLFDAWELRCAESRKKCHLLLQNGSSAN